VAGAGGRAAAAGRAAPAAGQTGSAPVGTAPSAAGRAGYKPRTRPQLGPASGSKRAPKNKYNPAGKQTPGPTTTTQKHGPGGIGGKTTTTKQGKNTTTTSTRRSALPFFLGGGGSGKGGPAQARHVLLGEFIACAVIIALSPLTDRHKSDTPAALIKRSTSIAVLFLFLALVSSGGPRSARVAAAFGALVTVALLVSERDLFAVIAKRVNAGQPVGPAGPEGTEGSAPAGEQMGPINRNPIPGFDSPDSSGGSIWDRIISGLGPI
jgi:hypothetical protein